MFGFSAFAEVPFASLPSAGQTGILGSLALTLDDITVSATGATTHVNSGFLTLVLDDLLITATGNVASSNNGTLSLTLDDIEIESNGTVTYVNNGTFALTLDDVFIEITGLIGGNFITIALEDILFASDGTVEPAPVTFTQTRGGYKAKKKEYKNNNSEIEKAVAEAVESVTGKPKSKIDEKIVNTISAKESTFVEDYAKILQLETDKATIEFAMAQMLEAERDDEEALLLLL